MFMISLTFRALKKSYLARLLAWALVHNPVDIVAMLLPRRRWARSKKRVVFVKMDGVGDYIIWTAAFDALSKKYPATECERILIGNDRVRDLAEAGPVFDEKIFVDVARLAESPRYRFSVMRQLRALDADVIVNPRLTRDFLWGDSIVRCSGAKVRIGSRGIENLMSPFQERISSRWYTELVAAPEPGVHELISNSRFHGSGDTVAAQPPIISSTKTRSAPDGDYAVFFLGAFGADKRWPMAKFASTAMAVAESHGLEIILCGGPGEENLAEEFRGCFDGDLTSLIGKTSLLDLAGVIARAKVTVTNDTAAGHIAVAQRCPVVVITPGNHVGRFFPYPAELTSSSIKQLSVVHKMPCFGCGWHCIYTDLDPSEAKPCIAGVSVDDVVMAVGKLLDNEVDV